MGWVEVWRVRRGEFSVVGEEEAGEGWVRSKPVRGLCCQELVGGPMVVDFGGVELLVSAVVLVVAIFEAWLG